MQEPLINSINEHMFQVNLKASVGVQCRCGKLLKIIRSNDLAGSGNYIVTVPPCEACLNTAISPFISEGERY